MCLRNLLLITAMVHAAMTNAALAQDSWTEIGGYGFITEISGDATIRNVTTDVDVPFKDILENLDLGFMGFVEHRRGKLSFIGDVFYASIAADKSLAVNATTSATISVGADVKQLLAEGFVGYRVYEQDYGDDKLGIDLLGGVRYNSIETDIEVGIQALGLSASASRNRTEDWADGVVGVRVQYGVSSRWGVSGWVDVGNGQDSSSYQLAGILSYRFDNKVKAFGGYRHLHFEYEDTGGANPIKLDLDYSGPMIGLSYRF